MLIRGELVLRELERRRTELATETLRSPPADYAGFTRLSGRYQEILELETLIKELAKKED